MTLNLNEYRVNVPSIKHWLDKKEACDRIKEIGAIAVATQCPIIAVCYYVAELYGMTDALQTKIDALMCFYRVTHIEGWDRKKSND